MTATWIQFGILMLTIITLALHAERRFTRMEVKMDILWEAHMKALGQKHE